MPVLALDTSATASAAVVDDAGMTLATRSTGEPRRHAELLMPLIAQVLTEAGITRADLTAVVAGTGPAPFTGLRVGLVTARTLGLALGIPVHGVSSLDAVALATVVASDASDLDGRDVLVVTDARRREVYWARYRPVVAPGTRSVEVLDGPGVETPAALAAAGLDGALLVGAGTLLYPDLLPGTPGAPTEVDPADLARVALARLAAMPAVPAGPTGLAVPAGPAVPAVPAGVTLPTEPLYLRRPDAVPPAPGKRVLA